MSIVLSFASSLPAWASDCRHLGLCVTVRRSTLVEATHVDRITAHVAPKRYESVIRGAGVRGDHASEHG